MRSFLVAAPLAAFVVLGSCGTTIPPATQPRLEDVRLVGRRICTNLTSGGKTFIFPCPPLPTFLASGWVLSPPWTPSTTDPTHQHLNRVVQVTVSGPSLTEIDVELVRVTSAPNLALASVDPNLPGKPGEVAGAREVGVVAQDNGNGKTWKIDVSVSGCADFREIQIFNRSGSTRSVPLNVSLVRDPAEEVCVGGASGPMWASVSGGPGPGTPVNPKPTGPCPGGAAEKLFHVCENCANLHPASLNVYTGFMACSWSDVLAVFGHTGPAATKPQICTIQQVASRAACEGP
jgi:hypothetical protein